MDEYQSLDRPLFGVSTRRERLTDLVVGTVVSIFVIVTIVLSFASCTGDAYKMKGNDIFFGFCIAFECGSLLTLIFWYREGDVDPKFKKLIYFNSMTVALLCICANVYFFVHCHETYSNSTVT